MSAELLRKAAAQIREDCPIPERSRGNDFIDFPTGFAIQKAGANHDEACSTARTSGALLCDCEAIYPPWRRWRTLLAAADWLETCADLDDQYEFPEDGLPLIGRALAVARAYLEEDS